MQRLKAVGVEELVGRALRAGGEFDLGLEVFGPVTPGAEGVAGLAVPVVVGLGRGVGSLAWSKPDAAGNLPFWRSGLRLSRPDPYQQEVVQINTILRIVLPLTGNAQKPRIVAHLRKLSNKS